jgi:hypothetical protein
LSRCPLASATARRADARNVTECDEPQSMITGMSFLNFPVQRGGKTLVPCADNDHDWLMEDVVYQWQVAWLG